MDLLACFTSQNNQGPLKNCSQFQQHNFSNFQDCLSQYPVKVFDNYMLFFGQIEPICQYYNNSSPTLSAATILEVFLILIYSIYIYFVSYYRIKGIVQ